MATPRLIEKRLLWAAVVGFLAWLLSIYAVFRFHFVDLSNMTGWVYVQYAISYIVFTALFYSLISLVNTFTTLISNRAVHDDVVAVIGGPLFATGLARFNSEVVFHLALDGRLVEEVNGSYQPVQIGVVDLAVIAVLIVVGLILMVKG